MDLAPGVYAKYESAAEDGTSFSATQELMKVAGTAEVGKDGRLLHFRRQRRYRLGVRSGQLRDVGYGPLRLEHRRFEALDEEHVANKLLDAAWEPWSQGCPLQW